MQQSDIHDFLERYFLANGCELIENTASHLSVQLTAAMDKELMNRPFYWHYLEKTGGIPNPAVMTLITDPKQAPPSLKGEVIHFGSPRLHQIFRTSRSLAGHIRLYEKTSGKKQGSNTALHPWLAANIKVSYVCDRKKDKLYSLGLHLLTGQIVEEFHSKMLKKDLTPRIPDFAYTLSPIIMPKSGIMRLDKYVRLQMADEEHTWAEEAVRKWEKDLRLLEHFYTDDEDNENLELEKEALRQQYEPYIHISVVNGGMFYLDSAETL